MAEKVSISTEDIWIIADQFLLCHHPVVIIVIITKTIQLSNSLNHYTSDNSKGIQVSFAKNLFTQLHYSVSKRCSSAYSFAPFVLVIFCSQERSPSNWCVSLFSFPCPENSQKEALTPWIPNNYQLYYCVIYNNIVSSWAWSLGRETLLNRTEPNRFWRVRTVLFSYSTQPPGGHCLGR